MNKCYFSRPKRLTWHPDLRTRKTLIVMELCLLESCHPFPERLVNTWEKVAVRKESSLTSLLLFLSNHPSLTKCPCLIARTLCSPHSLAFSKISRRIQASPPNFPSCLTPGRAIESSLPRICHISEQLRCGV